MVHVEMILLTIIITVVILYGIRRYCVSQWRRIENPTSLKGKVFIITGASTGLGYETTLHLIKRQATVIMACRDLENTRIAIYDLIGEAREGFMIPLELDLSSLRSIRAFVKEIKEHYPVFNCLIHNAGILSTEQNEVTSENLEIQFGVNHFGPFLLTNLMADMIKVNNARIVIVSSGGHESGFIDFENFGKYPSVPPFYWLFNDIIYKNSKLANMYFAKELYKRNFDVHVLCPGLCFTYRTLYDFKWYTLLILSPLFLIFLRSAEQGAQNIVYTATDNINTKEKNTGNGYIVKNMEQIKSSVNFSDEISEKLWKESEKIVGISTIE